MIYVHRVYMFISNYKHIVDGTHIYICISLTNGAKRNIPLLDFMGKVLDVVLGDANLERMLKSKVTLLYTRRGARMSCTLHANNKQYHEDPPGHVSTRKLTLLLDKLTELICFGSTFAA